MKHVFGYGLLILALVFAVVWGCKRIPNESAAACPPVKALQSGHSGTNFQVDLMPKASYKYSGNVELTDHPADYLKPTDPKQLLASFTWILPGKFTITFTDPKAVPCKEGQSVPSTTTADSAGNFIATCTLLPGLLGKSTVHYPYSVIWSGAATQATAGPKGPPVTTCEGCFLEID